MTRLVYREPQPISRSDAKSAFDSGDPSQIIRALVGLTYHDPDWKWVERTCLDFCDHSDPQVRGLAASCLGELARIHGQIDAELVIPRLRAMLKVSTALGDRSDWIIQGQVQDALNDIHKFNRLSHRGLDDP